MVAAQGSMGCIHHAQATGAAPGPAPSSNTYSERLRLRKGELAAPGGFCSAAEGPAASPALCLRHSGHTRYTQVSMEGSEQAVCEGQAAKSAAAPSFSPRG